MSYVQGVLAELEHLAEVLDASAGKPLEDAAIVYGALQAVLKQASCVDWRLAPPLERRMRDALSRLASSSARAWEALQPVIGPEAAERARMMRLAGEAINLTVAEVEAHRLSREASWDNL